MSSGQKRRLRRRRKKIAINDTIAQAAERLETKKNEAREDLQAWLESLPEEISERVEQELRRAAVGADQRVADLKATVRTLLSEMFEQANELAFVKDERDEAQSALEDAQGYILDLPRLQRQVEQLANENHDLKGKVTSANARADRYRREKDGSSRRLRQQISGLKGQVALLSAELEAEKRRARGTANTGSVFDTMFGPGTFGGRTTSKLSRKDLMKLISLTHPDKHDNSETSTEVTQMLIAIRNAL